MAHSAVRRWIVMAAAVLADPVPVAAQHVEPHAAAFWLGGGVLIGAAVPADEWARSVATRVRSDRFARLAQFVEPLGRPQFLWPVLVGTYAVGRGTGQRDFADATLRTALSYGVTDALGHLLKIAVGRHRPSDGGSATRFKPFSLDPAWHSFPSGHTFQIFAIVAAAADETDRPWVGAVGYTLASLTGVQRVYLNDHWASDVVAGAFIAISSGLSVDRWIRRNGLGSLVKPRQPPNP